MYDSDGATLLTGTDDLLRAPIGRAIIGDKRNDEKDPESVFNHPAAQGFAPRLPAAAGVSYVCATCSTSVGPRDVQIASG